MFSRPDRCSHPVVPPPPRIHLGAYLTGGLKDLYHRISRGETLDNTDADVHTNAKGQFSPGHDGPVVMAQRYYITEVLNIRGQSAVLVYAEDLFDENKLVVIKILHTSYFNIGAQEAECLRRLAAADPLHVSHTVKLLNTFIYGGHYCMVFESLYPEPITEVFDSLQLPNCSHLEKIKKLTVQLLVVLGFLRQHNTIHADLKPENILLKHNSDLNSVQVIDFGNSIQHVHKEVSLYYQDFNVQTLLYRAPEVMFGIPFGTEIDMWSLGCILCELYLGKPLFFGRSKEEILSHITSILGPLPKEIFQRGKYSQELEKFTSDIQQEDATLKLMQHLPASRDYAFANFLAQLFRYDPDERLTPTEAAQHPFLAQELCISFLLPQASKKCQSSSIVLNSTTYKKKVKISSEVKRQNPSTYDLLVLGTELKTDPKTVDSPYVSSFQETKVAEVQPYKQEVNTCSPAHAQFKLPVHVHHHRSSRESSPHTSQQTEPSLDARTPPFIHSSHSHTSNSRERSVSRVHDNIKSERLHSPGKQRYSVPLSDVYRSASTKVSPSKAPMTSHSPVKQETVPFNAQSVQIIHREESRGTKHENRSDRTDRHSRNISKSRKDLNNTFHSPVKVLVSESPSRSANKFLSHSTPIHRPIVSSGRPSQSANKPSYGREVAYGPSRTIPESHTGGPEESFSMIGREKSESSSLRSPSSPSDEDVQGTLVKSKSLHCFANFTSPTGVQKPRISKFSVSPESNEKSDFSKSKRPDRTKRDVILSNKKLTKSPQLSNSTSESLQQRSDLQKTISGEHSSHSDSVHPVPPQETEWKVPPQETEWKLPLQVSARQTKTNLNLKRRKLILEQAAIESVQNQTALLVSDVEDLSGEEAHCIMLETTVECEELDREKKSGICSDLRDRSDTEQNKTVDRREGIEEVMVQTDENKIKSAIFNKSSITSENEQVRKKFFKMKSHSYDMIVSQGQRKSCEKRQVQRPMRNRHERREASKQHRVVPSDHSCPPQNEEESSDDEAVEVMANKSDPGHNDVRYASWYEKHFHEDPLQSSVYKEEREDRPPVGSRLELMADCVKPSGIMKDNSVTRQKDNSTKCRNVALENSPKADNADKNSSTSQGIANQKVYQNVSEVEDSDEEEFDLLKFSDQNLHNASKNKTLHEDKTSNPNQFDPSDEEEFRCEKLEQQKLASENMENTSDEWSSASDSEVNYIHGMNRTEHSEPKCEVKASQPHSEALEGEGRPGVSGGGSRVGMTHRLNTHHQTFTELSNQRSKSSQHEQEKNTEEDSPVLDHASSSDESFSPDKPSLQQAIPNPRVKPLEEKHEALEDESYVASRGRTPGTSSVPSYENPSISQQQQEELDLRESSPDEDEATAIDNAFSPSSGSSLLQLAEDSDDLQSHKSDVFDISYCSHEEEEEEAEDSDQQSVVKRYRTGLHAKRKLKFAKRKQSRVVFRGYSEAVDEVHVRDTNTSHHDPYEFYPSPSKKSNKCFTTSMNLSSKKAKSSIYRLKNRKTFNKRSIPSKRRKTSQEKSDKTTLSKRSKSTDNQSSVQTARGRIPTKKSPVTYRDLQTEADVEGVSDMFQQAGRKTMKGIPLVNKKTERAEEVVRTSTYTSSTISNIHTRTEEATPPSITGWREEDLRGTDTQQARRKATTETPSTSQTMHTENAEGGSPEANSQQSKRKKTKVSPITNRNLQTEIAEKANLGTNAQESRRKNTKVTHFTSRNMHTQEEEEEEEETHTQQAVRQTFKDTSELLPRKEEHVLQEKVQVRKQTCKKSDITQRHLLTESTKQAYPNNDQHIRKTKVTPKLTSMMQKPANKELTSERTEELHPNNDQHIRRTKVTQKLTSMMQEPANKELSSERTEELHPNNDQHIRRTKVTPKLTSMMQEPANKELSSERTEELHPNNDQHIRRTKVTQKLTSMMQKPANKELSSEQTEELHLNNVQEARRKKKRRRREGQSDGRRVMETLSYSGNNTSDAESPDSGKSKVCFRKRKKHDYDETFDSAQRGNYESGGESLERSSRKSSSRSCQTSVNRTVQELQEAARRCTPRITASPPRRTMNSTGKLQRDVDLNESVIFVREKRRGRKPNKSRVNKTPGRSHKRKRTQEHDEDEVVLLIS